MNPASILVYCTTCGTAMERRDDPDGDPGRECWLWFNLAGGLADKCPGCGAITSALTTTVHPSTREHMKSIRIRLTDDQVTQLAPVVQVLEQHADSGVGCIGQVLFYDDETVLLVGVMKAEPLTRVRQFTLADTNLFDLSPGTAR